MIDMSDRYDVIVIGGGPVGCSVARLVAEKGYKVAVFEEHESIGEPLHCAGLVTNRVFDLINDENVKARVTLNKIKGAVIHAPSGDKLIVEKDSSYHAYVINREYLDRILYDKAVKAGAQVHLGCRCVSMSRLSGSMRVDVKKTHGETSYQCDILVGADGVYSITRRLLSFPQPERILHGMGAEVTNTSLDPSFVHLFLGEHVAPHFFAWIIPVDKNGSEARIGLCVDPEAAYGNVKTYFKKLYSNRIVAPYIKDSKVLRYTAGAIPLGVLKKTVDDNALIVGDAAAQVKPVSGGGLYTGLLSAGYCADTILYALKKGYYSHDVLYRYHRAWMDSIGNELRNGMRFHMILSRLNDEEMNKYINKLNKPRILDIINKYGDIDYPSRLAAPLLKKQPSLLRLLMKLL